MDKAKMGSSGGNGEVQDNAGYVYTERVPGAVAMPETPRSTAELWQQRREELREFAFQVLD